MFQNPLRHQGSQTNDPFSTLGSDTDFQSSNEEFSTTANPFHHLFGNANSFTSENHINPEQHFINPHEVSGYDRADGVHVDGYWRDGDGNTSHDLHVEDGGGYMQTNPDGNLFNNFG